MANTVPTKLGLFKTIGLIFLFIFLPKKFIEKEKNDNSKRELSKERSDIPRIYVLRKALLNSFITIIISGIIGFIIGQLLSYFYSSPNAICIITMQIIAALILLWATLVVRGWDILSYSSVTFTERINQLIYRSLYCIGTSIFIISMIWK